jgi:hypothetical protein
MVARIGLLAALAAAFIAAPAQAQTTKAAQSYAAAPPASSGVKSTVRVYGVRAASPSATQPGQAVFYAYRYGGKGDETVPYTIRAALPAEAASGPRKPSALALAFSAQGLAHFAAGASTSDPIFAPEQAYAPMDEAVTITITLAAPVQLYATRLAVNPVRSASVTLNPPATSFTVTLDPPRVAYGQSLQGAVQTNVTSRNQRSLTLEVQQTTASGGRDTQFQTLYLAPRAVAVPFSITRARSLDPAQDAIVSVAVMQDSEHVAATRGVIAAAPPAPVDKTPPPQTPQPPSQLQPVLSLSIARPEVGPDEPLQFLLSRSLAPDRDLTITLSITQTAENRPAAVTNRAVVIPAGKVDAVVLVDRAPGLPPSRQDVVKLETLDEAVSATGVILGEKRSSAWPWIGLGGLAGLAVLWAVLRAMAAARLRVRVDLESGPAPPQFRSSSHPPMLVEVELGPEPPPPPAVVNPQWSRRHD